jgi:glycosyltransferase involved in cell wall biosynthesis
MISCIIPCYNEEDHIEGLLGKIPLNVEVIIVDNNCTDKTVDICKLYANLKIVKCQEQGQWYAKNIGAKHAKGDILVFLDADCRVSKNWFKEVDKISKDDKNIGGGTKWIGLDRYTPKACFQALGVGLLLIYLGVTIGAFWIRKEVFEKIQFRPCIFDDIDFSVRLKRYAESIGKNFRSIKRSYLVWNTRYV